MNKKGQGALEFLMTYGWAFLVILIMIGALAYFGVLSPSKFLPDRCNFSAEILCQKGQYQIQSTDDETVKVGLLNQFGSNVVVTDITTESDNANLNECSDPQANGANLGGGFTWAEGKTAVFSVDCTDKGQNLVPGTKEKVTLKLTWEVAGTTGFSHTALGEVYATVE